jgi:hypothetical protein
MFSRGHYLGFLILTLWGARAFAATGEYGLLTFAMGRGETVVQQAKEQSYNAVAASMAVAKKFKLLPIHVGVVLETAKIDRLQASSASPPTDDKSVYQTTEGIGLKTGMLVPRYHMMWEVSGTGGRLRSRLGDVITLAAYRAYSATLGYLFYYSKLSTLHIDVKTQVIQPDEDWRDRHAMGRMHLTTLMFSLNVMNN